MKPVLTIVILAFFTLLLNSNPVLSSTYTCCGTPHDCSYYTTMSDCSFVGGCYPESEESFANENAKILDFCNNRLHVMGTCQDSSLKKNEESSTNLCYWDERNDVCDYNNDFNKKDWLNIMDDDTFPHLATVDCSLLAESLGYDNFVVADVCETDFTCVGNPNVQCSKLNSKEFCEQKGCTWGLSPDAASFYCSAGYDVSNACTNTEELNCESTNLNGRSYIIGNNQIIGHFNTENGDSAIYQLDVQKNVKAVVYSNGTIKGQEFYPFGGTLSLGINSKLQYKSLPIDVSTGLYLGVYDPEIGRYLSPLKQEDVFMPQKFAGYIRTNNPYRNIDKSELYPDTISLSSPSSLTATLPKSNSYISPTYRTLGAPSSTGSTIISEGVMAVAFALPIYSPGKLIETPSSTTYKVSTTIKSKPVYGTRTESLGTFTSSGATKTLMDYYGFTDPKAAHAYLKNLLDDPNVNLYVEHPDGTRTPVVAGDFTDDGYIFKPGERSTQGGKVVMETKTQIGTETVVFDQIDEATTEGKSVKTQDKLCGVSLG